MRVWQNTIFSKPVAENVFLLRDARALERGRRLQRGRGESMRAQRLVAGYNSSTTGTRAPAMWFERALEEARVRRGAAHFGLEHTGVLLVAPHGGIVEDEAENVP